MVDDRACVEVAAAPDEDRRAVDDQVADAGEPRGQRHAHRQDEEHPEAFGFEGRLASPDWLARDFRAPRPLEREGWANVAAFVTNDPGPVYADNVGLLLVAGKEVRYTDPFSLAYAARTGQWDETALVERVRRGDFSLIALRYDVFAEDGAPADLTPALYAAIRERYRVIERNVVIVYAPR